MSATISQASVILHHLLVGQTITPLEALNLCGCMRLGARIYDLRDVVTIESRTVKTPGGKHVSEYYLPDNELKRLDGMTAEEILGTREAKEATA